MRVVAFNAGGHGNVEALARCLERKPLAGAGVVMLCEVDANMRRSGGRSVAVELAAALKMSCAFVTEFLGSPVNPSAARSRSGNAILCVEPLRQARAIPLPNPTRRLPRRLSRGEPCGLAAIAEIDGHPLTLAVAHLDSRANPAQRAQQMGALMAGMAPEGRAVVGGDFNTTTTELSRRGALITTAARMLIQPGRFHAPEPYEPLFGKLGAAGFKVEGANVPGRATFTFSRALPTLIRPKLDWLALRELEPVPGSAAVVSPRTGFFAARLSDHDFIVCDVSLA